MKYHNGLIAGEKFYNQLLDQFKNFRNNIDNQLNQGMRSLNIGQQFPTQPMLNRTQSSGLQSNYTGQSSISHSGSLSGQPSGGYNQPQPQQQQLQQQAQFSGAYNQQYSQPHGGYTQFQGYGQGSITNWLSTTTTTSTTTITTQTKYGILQFATTLQQQQQPQQQRTPQNESNLIYDNPSTYNPNMYNFFSSK